MHSVAIGLEKSRKFMMNFVLIIFDSFVYVVRRYFARLMTSGTRAPHHTYDPYDIHTVSICALFSCRWPFHHIRVALFFRSFLCFCACCGSCAIVRLCNSPDDVHFRHPQRLTTTILLGRFYCLFFFAHYFSREIPQCIKMIN